MEEIQELLNDSWDNLFSCLNSDISGFLIAIMIAILVLMVWRIVIGG